jgi:hypothetical protein
VLNLKAPFGAYPVELGETYPFNAEVLESSEPDYEAASVCRDWGLSERRGDFIQQ